MARLFGRHDRARSGIVALVACLAALVTVPVLAASGGEAEAAIATGGIENVVPKPTSVTAQSGSLVISSSTEIWYQTRSNASPIEQTLEPLAEVLAAELELITGIRPPVRSSGSGSAGPGDISLQFESIASSVASEAEQDQSYRLNVSDRAVVSSQYYKGVAYGTTTLTQALFESNDRFSMAGVRVDDRPASGYRAVMVDIARKRHSVETLREIVDMLRQYKTRYLHLHLTDNENFAYPFAPVTDNLTTGNYTIGRSDFQALVSYADARGVTIIPEFEIPGHSAKLRQSGYIDATNDREVASPQNYAKLKTIIDDMSNMFASSPYFHLGGDESAAGSELVPLLAEMNRHIRSKPAAQRKRTLVWEGFHGAPASIPATGPDRVVVMSWESSYNPPWSLLENGYQVINASWKPMYVVGHGAVLHPGAGGKRWDPSVIYRWDSNTFMHWEPGRPLFEDSGPSDPNLNDSVWKASYIGRQNQVIGGSMLFWEQPEWFVVDDLRDRLPAMSERLWNPSAGSYGDFQRRWNAIDDRVMTIVRPIEILPTSLDTSSPMSEEYRIYEGDSLAVTVRNRSKIEGTVRYVTDPWDGRYEWVFAGPVPPVTASSAVYNGPVTVSGGVGVKARLYRPDGSPVGGTSLAIFNNWPQRVVVTQYVVGPREFTDVPNTDGLATRATKKYRMPELRGPAPFVTTQVQRQEATLRITNGGSYTFSSKTAGGRASFYIDLNRNGRWEDSERLVTNTPSGEQWIQSRTVNLSAGTYKIRVDHLARLPAGLVSAAYTGPDTNGRLMRVDQRLEPLEGIDDVALDVVVPGGQPKPGWDGLAARPGESATVGGATFTLFGFDDGDYRSRDDYLSVNSDFAFSDGPGALVGLQIDGLRAGTYRVESWHSDLAGHPGRVRGEFGKQGSAPSVLVAGRSFSTSPIVYNITVDGQSTYELVFREDDYHNRSRFNGIRVRRVGDGPPPDPDPQTPAANTNLALDRPTRTSSLEGSTGRSGAQAVDGDDATRWSSAYADPQWLEVDLGARYDIATVLLNWETAFGRAYKVQVSDDQSTWTDIYSTTSGDGGIDYLTGLSGSGRYVRMYGAERGTQWGFSPWEFEVYGTPSAN